jgi:hypothetical protein
LYLTAEASRRATRVSPSIHIFPTRFTVGGWERLQDAGQQQPSLINFWKELAEVDSVFEATRGVPAVLVDATGAYRVATG